MGGSSNVEYKFDAHILDALFRVISGGVAMLSKICSQLKPCNSTLLYTYMNFTWAEIYNKIYARGLFNCVQLEKQITHWAFFMRAHAFNLYTNMQHFEYIQSA